MDTGTAPSTDASYVSAYAIGDVGNSENVSDFPDMCKQVVRLAALFHDIGKQSRWFQSKLRKSLTSSELISDLVRHELVSSLVVSAIFERYDTDKECFQEMSCPDQAARIIKKAFEDVCATPDLYAFGVANSRFDVFIKQIMRKEKDRSRSLKRPDFAQRPIYCLSTDLILTHHRLTGSASKVNSQYEVVSGTELIKCTGTAIAKSQIESELSEIFQKPPKLKCIWEDQQWLMEIAEVCASLAQIEYDFQAEDRKAVSVIGRTGLILADHKASAFGSKNFLREKSANNNLSYANTTRDAKLRYLAEPLASHMTRVGVDTIAAGQALLSAVHDFPSISLSSLPEMIIKPPYADGSRFDWQSDASEVTKHAIASLPAGSGFFGILMAGTGAGKTKATPIIMSAAHHDTQQTMRLSVSSGLRSLTLQSGKEYIADMGFDPSDVSIVIGDELTSDLFALDNPVIDSGSETFEIDHSNVVRVVDDREKAGLPEVVNGFVSSEMEPSIYDLLSAPVLVSTIDTLMAAASGRRGNHVQKMLRVASSDLVIDEIDNFSDEDITTIARLVYLHAMFGRKVLISSATIYPEIADYLYQAYSYGWAVHNKVVGRNIPINVGWYSDTAECRCLCVENTNDFVDQHRVFTNDIVSKIVCSFPRRKVEISSQKTYTSPTAYVIGASSHATRLHHDNHVIDPSTGKNISIGVYKWNNALTSMIHATHLSNHGIGDDHDVFVVPYNGTLLPVVRYEIDKALNSMLNRKSTDGSEVFLQNPIVRNVLDQRSTKKNVVIIVVTTSLEETGRDHDFDWAVIEPGSQRSLIQLAGRVRRHRHEPWEKPNIVILEQSFREVRAVYDGYTIKHVFAYPGFETPDVADSFLLESHRASDCYDLDTIKAVVDARETIMVDQPKGLIAQKERELTHAYLDGSICNGNAGLVDFFTDPAAMIHGHHIFKRRFRRQDAKNFSFMFQSHDIGWGVVIEQGKRKKIVQNVSSVENVRISTERLLINLTDEEALRDRYASLLWGEDAKRNTKSRALLTISRPVRSRGKGGTSNPLARRYLYDLNLGFSEIPGWLDQEIIPREV